MLVSFIIGLSFLILFFIFIGVNIIANLKDKSYKIIFIVLLGITYLTILEIIFCIYLFVKFRNKNGEEGPRGFQGHPGDIGDDGKCNNKECRKDLLVIMIAKIFEKKLKRKLNNEENKILFTNFKNNATNLELKNFIDESLPKNLNSINLEYLKKFNEKLTEKIELGYITIHDFEPIISNGTKRLKGDANDLIKII